jgi:hypothetical protein
MKPRIYIAGKMSGIADFNYPAFHAEAARLRAIGFHVENPAENSPQATWQGYMRQALRQMMTCDAVALLPGWERSRGAQIERALAIDLGIRASPCTEYKAPATDPNCWFCEGFGEHEGKPCLICLEVRC